MPTTERGQLILGLAKDNMLDFLVYDRKNCEQLSVGEVGQALAANEVTIDEILAVFREALEAEQANASWSK